MKLPILMIALFLSSCAKMQNPSELIFGAPEYANMQQMIEMQNPYTREVVFCIKDATQTAEDCAKIFESYGFIKLREIPYKLAGYDVLRKNTYPTRRWRDGERTPRW